MDALITWVESHQGLLASLGALSVFTFFVSLLLLPLVIILLPTDYFVRSAGIPVSSTPVRAVLRILKNFLGLCILLAGILMLFLPGQGILAILFGCSLVDFPKKRQIQIKILSGQRVRGSVNWIRRKGGKPPLEIPSESMPD